MENEFDARDCCVYLEKYNIFIIYDVRLKSWFDHEPTEDDIRYIVRELLPDVIVSKFTPKTAVSVTGNVAADIKCARLFYQILKEELPKGLRMSVSLGDLEMKVSQPINEVNDAYWDMCRELGIVFIEAPPDIRVLG